MKRIDTEGGQRLKNIGVSEGKFNSINLPLSEHFKDISTEKACTLINAIRNELGSADEAFDKVWKLLRKNPSGFEDLCVNPESIEDHGIGILYKLIDNVPTNQFNYEDSAFWDNGYPENQVNKAIEYVSWGVLSHTELTGEYNSSGDSD